MLNIAIMIIEILWVLLAFATMLWVLWVVAKIIRFIVDKKYRKKYEDKLILEADDDDN